MNQIICMWSTLFFRELFKACRHVRINLPHDDCHFNVLIFKEDDILILRNFSIGDSPQGVWMYKRGASLFSVECLERN